MFKYSWFLFLQEFISSMFSKEMNFFKLDIRMVTSVRFVSFFFYVKENRWFVERKLQKLIVRSFFKQLDYRNIKNKKITINRSN